MVKTGITTKFFLFFLLFTYFNDVTEAISQIYTNHFLVHLNKPGIENAHRVAKRNGFINRGMVKFNYINYKFKNK